MTVERENIFPEGLPKRIVGGHLLYAPVITVVPGKLVFLSGMLSRNREGEIVGKGDMRRQIQQVFSNIQIALASVGATMADIVKRQTFTTDIDAYYKHIDARMEICGDLAVDQHGRGSETPVASRLSDRGRGHGGDQIECDWRRTSRLRGKRGDRCAGTSSAALLYRLCSTCGYALSRLSSPRAASRRLRGRPTRAARRRARPW